MRALTLGGLDVTDLQTRLQTALGAGIALERELEAFDACRAFLASERGTGRRLMVKVLPGDLGGDADPERFRQEIHLAASLEHPHIAPLVAGGTVAGGLYYEMPVIDGESLRARIQRERQLPLDLTISIAEDLADALVFAHRQGVVHANLSPDVVILGKDPERHLPHPVILDFGIAHAVARAFEPEARARASRCLGVPRYMSPERARDGVEVDTRADVYGLGCIVYEMLTGQPAFSEESAKAVVAMRSAFGIPQAGALRTDVPDRVDLAISGALEPDPDQRFASVREFLGALTGRRISTPSGERAALRASPKRGVSASNTASMHVASAAGAATPSGAASAAQAPAPAPRGTPPGPRGPALVVDVVAPAREAPATVGGQGTGAGGAGRVVRLAIVVGGMLLLAAGAALLYRRTRHPVAPPTAGRTAALLVLAAPAALAAARVVVRDDAFPLSSR